MTEPRPRRPLVKKLTYRVPGPVSLAAHQAHWDGFQWSSGPVIVVLISRFGQWKVFASSEGEGRRVLGHAAAIAGLDVSPGSGVEWIVSEATGGRIGRVATMETARTEEGIPVVTSRVGSNGYPVLREGSGSPD